MNTTRQPQEDQYVMPVEASRRGAHRARVNPLLGALPFVAVAVVVIGVVALAWTLFGGGGGGTSVQAGAVSSASSQPASASKSPAGSKSPAAQDTPAQTKSEQPAPSKTQQGSTLDKTQAIVVRNSTRTAGLAKGAASKLTARGWKINGIPDNYRPTINSTVFYNDAALKANAQAVARILGINLVKLDAANSPKGVTVVLGPDYAA